MTHPHALRHPGGHPHGGKGPVVREIKHDVNEKPFIVIWEVTRACQLACAHCRAVAQPKPHPAQLTTAQGKKLLDQLAEYDHPKPMVVFTDAGFRLQVNAKLTRGNIREAPQMLQNAINFGAFMW